MKTILFVILVILFIAENLPGQEAISIGHLVRVSGTEISNKPVVGKLIAIKSDTLFLTINPHPNTKLLEICKFEKLEISRGKTEPKRGKYAWRGFLIGAAAGALIGQAICPDLHYEDSGTMGVDESFCRPVGIFGIGLIGTSIGAINGGPDIIWEQVSLRF